ncbi:unnamed protein product [Rotaria sordida]|nr:unnamed protein product [Rotaria sordida]
MIGITNHYFILILLSIIVQVKSQICQEFAQYDKCSTNNACGCFHMTDVGNIGMCGFLEIDCSQVKPCNSSNNACNLSDSICVRHPRCNDLPLCYPLSMIDQRICPSIKKWINTGKMNYARYMHKASILSNGQVLIMGGIGDRAIALKSAELYNSSTKTWTMTGNMSYTRFGHTASVLTNGKVLVTGGDGHSQYLNTAELYDPLTETWTNTGNMNYPRYLHTATVLPNGKVLVTGGWMGDYLNNSELYDPLTETWTIAGVINNSLSYHTASMLKNGKVLISGGVDPKSIALNSSVLYDPST